MRHFSVTDRPDAFSGNGFVWAFNANYSFSLKQEAKEKPWALNNLQFTKGSDSSHSGPDGAKEVLSAFLGILMRIGPTEMAELIQHPSFRVLEAKNVDHEGHAAVLIAFENTHPINDKHAPFTPVQSGTVLLDPNSSWCLCAGKVKTKWGNGEGTLEIETSYRSSRSGHPIPVRVVQKSTRMDSGEFTRGRQESEFDCEDNAVLPDYGEFTLSAFGLPEPMGMPSVKRPGSRWYVWLAWVTTGLVVVGAFLAVLAKRFRKAPEIIDKTQTTREGVI